MMKNAERRVVLWTFTPRYLRTCPYHNRDSASEGVDAGIRGLTIGGASPNGGCLPGIPFPDPTRFRSRGQVQPGGYTPPRTWAPEQ
jgi:hypothetical protein